MVPPAKLKDLKAKENIPSVEESCRLVMLVLCDFLKELAEPLWNEEFTRYDVSKCFVSNSSTLLQLLLPRHYDLVGSHAVHAQAIPRMYI